MFGQSNCLHLINFSVANIQTIFLIPITQVVFYKKTVELEAAISQSRLCNFNTSSFVRHESDPVGI